MANMSDAHGYLYLEGEWQPQQIKKLAYILYVQDFLHYNIHFSADFQDFENRLQSEFGAPFSGAGRWHFGNNLDSLKYWYEVGEKDWNKRIIFPLALDMITYDEYLKMARELFNDMAVYNLKLVWEYMDLEPGCDFLIACIGEHVSSFDSEISGNTLNYTENVVQGYDCNLKNQCEIFLECDYDHLYEVIYTIMDFYKLPDKFKNILEELIMQHDTWYDLPAYPYFEKKTHLPTKLRKDVIKLIKEDK